MEHAEYGYCHPYSNAWCEAYNDASREERKALRQEARVYRASEPAEPQCIRLYLSQADGRGYDRITTFRCVGWRGALAILRVYAPRACRADRGRGRIGVAVCDDRVETTLEMWAAEGVEGVSYRKAETVADRGVW